MLSSQIFGAAGLLLIAYILKVRSHEIIETSLGKPY